MVSAHLGIGQNVIIHLLIDSEVGIGLYRMLNALEQGNDIILVFQERKNCHLAFCSGDNTTLLKLGCLNALII